MTNALSRTDDAVAGGAESTPELLRVKQSAQARRPKAAAISASLFVVVLLVWQFVAPHLVSTIVLPPATDVWGALKRLLSASYFPSNLWTTVKEVLIGFAFASVTAVLLATALAFFPLARAAMYPYILTLQLTPSIVLAPIFIIWFGFGITSKVMLAAVTAFFVILVSTLNGFDSVDRESVELMQSLCASKNQIFSMLTVRSALPFIFTGLQTGVTLALIGVLVAEYLSASSGLGVLLTQFSFTLQQDMVFATTIITVALGMTLYGILTLIARKVVWWT